MAKRIMFSILSLITAILILTSCCDSNLITEFNFTQKDLTINPYNGTEKLIFKSLTGDSINFQAVNRQSTFSKRYQKSSNGDSKACLGDYVTSENNNTAFQSTDNLLRFTIKLLFDYNFTNLDPNKLILFESYSHPNDHNPPSSSREAYFGVDTIYNHGNYPDTIYTFHNILILGPKSFNNVYEVYLIASVLSSVTTLYYTIGEGIVGFNTQKEGKWYLDKTMK
jgi:hypothetical protein